MSEHWDAIVVGAGSSGAVVASRLAAAGRRVLVLEAGDVSEPFPAAFEDARVVPGAAPDPAWTWQYRGMLSTDRPYEVVRGRGLGGSSAVNGCYFARPLDTDLEAWAALGGQSWAVPLMHARMDRIEDHVGVSPSPTIDGFEPVQLNVVDGRRRNIGAVWLDAEARALPNLTLCGGSTVRRLLREGDGVTARVVGVEYAEGGVVRAARADDVVLAAGPVNSAQLLGLRDAPFRDHPQLIFAWSPEPPLREPDGSWLGGALYRGDTEVLATLRPLDQLGTLPPPEPTSPGPLGLLATILRTDAAGTVRLTSAEDPRSPMLDYRYLSSGADRARARAAVRLVAEVLEDLPHSWDDLPAAAVLADDVALDAFVHDRLRTAYHGCGTAAIGSVADGTGRIPSMPGVRVADLSLLPSPPHRGTALTAVLIGETIADVMLER